MSTHNLSLIIMWMYTIVICLTIYFWGPSKVPDFVTATQKYDAREQVIAACGTYLEREIRNGN